MIFLLLLVFLGLAAYTLYRALQNSTKQVVFTEIYRFVALVTLGLVPALWYLLESHLPTSQLSYQMPVSAWVYFTYTLPGLVALYLGTTQFSKKSLYLPTLDLQAFSSPIIALMLIAAGAAFYGISPFTLLVFKQLVHFGKMLLGVGVIHLLFTPISPYYKIGASLSFIIFLFYQFLVSTFIGDLIVWLMWLLLFAQLRIHWTPASLAGLGLLVCIPLLMLLSFKYSFREKVRANPETPNLELFSSSLEAWLTAPLDALGWQRALIRLNQGEHLARVYRWVPEHEPYARGQSLWPAFAAAAIPRFCWPDKPGAGGQENWKRFTGKSLDPGISMNIGIFGESYANFGPYLGPIFIFLWARLLFYALNLFYYLSSKYHTTVWLWIPLVYFNLIDQEGDLITQLNHLVKGSLFVLGCYMLIYLSNRVFYFIRANMVNK